MVDLKKIFDTGLSTLLYTFGVSWLYSNLVNRHRNIPIVFYHEIGGIDSTLVEYSVNVKTFEEQIVWLKQNYDVVSVNDLVKHISGQKMLRGNIAAITFDGGYSGNYVHAYPILKQYDCPATVYVITDPLDGKLAWHRQLVYLFSMTKRTSLTFVGGDDTKIYLNLRTKTERKEARELIRLRMAGMNEGERKSLLEYLSRELQVDLAGLPQKLFLSWDQVREMRQSKLIEIGSHTLSHPRLPSLPLEDARREICGSKQRIKEELGESIDSFCYPDGELSPEIINIVKDAGYTSALVVTTPGIWNDLNAVGDDVYDLRRICMPDQSYRVLLQTELSGIMRIAKRKGKTVFKKLTCERGRRQDRTL